ncbi:MAG: DUF5106 domain-containing protein [Muribaculaceae bacterium]|nr:DUF5106 domain-containing protein [Muribaculaceae bacterium]
MTKKFNNTLKTTFLSLSILCAIPSYAQDPVEIAPLFEYPSAPQEIESINDKSNYLVDHFWDAMDFKSKKTVDQNALNDAFSVYSVPMRWADKTKTLASADRLIEKISKNPTLMIQFMKAAEEALYGPRAEAWIDEVYVKFLNAFIKNKKIPDSRKNKYRIQLASLEKTIIGSPVPEFKFTDRHGKDATYFPMTTPTILIFGNPSLTDWRLSRLRMESNTALSQAVEKGKVNVIYIVSSENPDWKNEISDYSDKWTVGYAPTIGESFDLRVMPSIYVIGADGKIILKNVTPENAINEVITQAK